MLQLIIAIEVVCLAALAAVSAFHEHPGEDVMLARFGLGLVLVLAAQTFALRWMRGGRFHPVIAWLNWLVETTAPFAAIVLLGVAVGPNAALTSPVAVVWGAAVVFSVHRASPLSSVLSGAVAAAQALWLWWWLRPPVPPQADLVLPLGLGGAALRALFLFVAGLAAALLARLQRQRAARTLRALREQDLMGKYVLHERIGQGGMAEVFRGSYCPEGGFLKTVAVKRVRPELGDDVRFIEAFREEARLGSLLHHPNVVQVLDFGRLRERYMLAVEFVDGLSLQALLVRVTSPVPVAAVSWLGAELARGLDHIHGRRGPDGRALGLVHRDVNPPNVLLSRLGEVKLSDFGVASAVDRRAVQREGAFAGKRSWASPEQLRGLALDGRSDLFALGLVLRAALAAGVPGDDEARGLSRPEVPETLRAVVSALLAPNVEARPGSAAAVRATLLGLRGEAAPQPHGPEALAALVVRHAEDSVGTA